MKFLIFLFFPLWAFSQNLKPGVYRDLKADKPLVLDTGNYTFINLQMKDLGKGIWIDGRKATKLTVLHSHFSGNGAGIAIATNNRASVSGCHFSRMEKAIWATVSPVKPRKKSQSRTGNTFTELDYGMMAPVGIASTTTPYSITGNMFDGNKYGVYLGNGTYSLELKCNAFKETEGIPLGDTHIGLEISENASIENNRIGGSPATDPVGTPNANRWPLSSTAWDLTTTPPTLPLPVDDFVTIQNQSDQEIHYWKYHNEFLENLSNTNGGDIVKELLPGQKPTYVYSVADMCQLGSNCGESNAEACITAVAFSNSCSTLTLSTNVNWERACEGTVVDFVDWPIFIPRPGQPMGENLTPNATLEIKPGLQLGQSQPNPGRTTIQIPYFLPEESGKTELWITEVSSGKLLGTRLLFSPGQGQMEVSLSDYANGIYAYRLIPQNGKASRTRKFVVIR